MLGAELFEEKKKLGAPRTYKQKTGTHIHLNKGSNLGGLGIQHPIKLGSVHIYRKIRISFFDLENKMN